MPRRPAARARANRAKPASSTASNVRHAVANDATSPKSAAGPAAPRDPRSSRRHPRASPPDRPAPDPDHNHHALLRRGHRRRQRPFTPTRQRDHTPGETPRGQPRSCRHQSPPAVDVSSYAASRKCPPDSGTWERPLSNRSIPRQEGVFADATRPSTPDYRKLRVRPRRALDDPLISVCRRRCGYSPLPGNTPARDLASDRASR